MVWERLKPDLEALRLSPKNDEDHLPLNTKLKFWKPSVIPLNVFETLAPCVVFKLNPRNGCQETEGLGNVVLASRKRDFSEKIGQLISSLLKNGFGFFVIAYSFLRLHRDRKKGNNDNECED